MVDYVMYCINSRLRNIGRTMKEGARIFVKYVSIVLKITGKKLFIKTLLIEVDN